MAKEKQAVKEKVRAGKSVYILVQGKRTPKFVKVAQIYQSELMDLVVNALESQGMEVYIQGDEQSQ